MINAFLIGVYVSSFGAAGLFFFKFWYRTRRRFFFLFSLSFWMLAVERVLLFFHAGLSDEYGEIYVVRIVAFTLILIAIADNNRRRQAPNVP